MEKKSPLLILLGSSVVTLLAALPLDMYANQCPQSTGNLVTCSAGSYVQFMHQNYDNPPGGQRVCSEKPALRSGGTLNLSCKFVGVTRVHSYTAKYQCAAGGVGASGFGGGGFSFGTWIVDKELDTGQFDPTVYKRFYCTVPGTKGLPPIPAKIGVNNQCMAAGNRTVICPSGTKIIINPADIANPTAGGHQAGSCRWAGFGSQTLSAHCYSGAHPVFQCASGRDWYQLKEAVKSRIIQDPFGGTFSIPIETKNMDTLVCP